MTTIKFFKENENYMGFECSGHAGFAEEGSDILCSAISSLTQGACLGITKVLNLKAEISKADGFLKLELLENSECAQALLKTLKASLEDIREGSEKYIQIRVVKRSK